jgi:hypothetical protein
METADVRVLGDDLGSIDEFNIHDHSLEVIFEHSMSMFEGLALPQCSQARRGEVRNTTRQIHDFSLTLIWDAPLMEKMKDNILESILGQVEFRSTNSPDVQDMSTRNFKSRRVSSRVEILFGSRMTPNDSRKLFGEIDTYYQRRDEDEHTKSLIRS